MTDKIKGLADVVGIQATKLDDAIAEERSAEVLLFEAVLESVRPAAKALSSRLMERQEVAGDGVLTVIFLPFRGLRLMDNEKAVDGKYDGTSLVLTDDGGLVELTVSGHYSSSVGPGLKQWTYRSITPAAAARRYSLRTCIETLTEKLEEYACGNAGKTAAKAMRQAERLRAVVTLLKSG